MGGGLLVDLDLLLFVLPLENLACFFFLLGTSLAPDKLSDLCFLLEALVTLSNDDVTLFINRLILGHFIKHPYLPCGGSWK